MSTITVLVRGVIRNTWPGTPHPVENAKQEGYAAPRRFPTAAMASRLAVQAVPATLSRAENTPPSSPSNSGQRQPRKPATTSRRLATTAAAAVVGAALLTPAASFAAGAFDLRLTLPEESSEEAEAVVRTHARNLLRVSQLVDAGAWRELQAALRASASNLKQDLYAIIQARPADQRSELRRLYSDLFNSVTSVSKPHIAVQLNRPYMPLLIFFCLCSQMDYAARDKDEVQVRQYYANMVSALDEIFAKIM